MLSKEYKLSMKVGYILKNIEIEHEEYRDIIQEWTDSGQIAELAREIINNETFKNNITYPDSDIAKITVMSLINKIDEKECFDIGYDEFTRGVIAGQIFGDLTIKNIQKAIIAEELWDDLRFGYYQEVCDYINNNT